MEPDQRKFKTINSRSPASGASASESRDGNGRRAFGAPNGINGIRAIDTRVAKGSNQRGTRGAFQALDGAQDGRGSIDSGAYSGHENMSGLGVSAEQQLLRNGANGGAHGHFNGRMPREEGLRLGGSPFQKNGMNGGGTYATGFKTRGDGRDELRNGRAAAFNTTNGKNRPAMLGFQLAAGLYNRYQSSKSRPGAPIAN